MNFINKYFLKLSKQTNLIPGAKDVINMLQNQGHDLIVISARGGMIEEMKKLNPSEYLIEVSNWGEIYRIIKGDEK